MAISTEVRGRRAGIGRRWRAWAGRRRFGLFILAALLTAPTLWLGARWWTSWPARLILKVPTGHYPMAFSPDGATVATASSTTGIVALWDVADGGKRAEWPSPADRRRYAGKFSPDGRTFVALTYLGLDPASHPVELIDVASGQTRATIAMPSRGAAGPYFRPGEGGTFRIVSYSPTSRDVVDVDLATGRAGPARRLSRPMGRDFAAISPDGHWLALSPYPPAPSQGVTIWDLDLDREAALLPATGSTSILAFSEDGATLAIGQDGGSIELWDVATRSLRATHRGHGPDYSPDQIWFSPDGATLLSHARPVSGPDPLPGHRPHANGPDFRRSQSSESDRLPGAGRGHRAGPGPVEVGRASGLLARRAVAGDGP